MNERSSCRPVLAIRALGELGRVNHCVVPGGHRILCTLIFLPVLPIGCSRPVPLRPGFDERIQYYSDKIDTYPRHCPAYAQLAVAYLDKARQTHDPTCLKKARQALRQSLEIQPNFQAFKTMAAVCNFAHRFEEALRWAKRAAEAAPDDTAVTAMLVEAYLGLGRYGDAETILPQGNVAPGDFHIAAARGHWFASLRRFNQAAAAFQESVDFARQAEEIDLVVWAAVSTAGALIDTSQLDQARKHLNAASRLDPMDLELRIHQAELIEAEGKLKKALASYEAILDDSNDPTIHAKVFTLARRLGQPVRAQRHFDAAEEGFRRAIDAGEVYTLGALAHLYAAADVHLELALDLARQNLQYKRDIAAQAILDSIRSKMEKR